MLLASWADVPGRGAVPRGGFAEFLDLMPAAGALVLLVVRPEVPETSVGAFAMSTAGLVR
ncbi:hypothetical protein ACIQUU_23795 [Streptomyces sp. NPDC101116]|uniref:hypothetical protein n=1 Tax=Streptomyces sp. NPDC101116 TaxID=3366107 RepID=UPI0038030FB6